MWYRAPGSDFSDFTNIVKKHQQEVSYVNLAEWPLVYSIFIVKKISTPFEYHFSLALSHLKSAEIIDIFNETVKSRQFSSRYINSDKLNFKLHRKDVHELLTFIEKCNHHFKQAIFDETIIFAITKIADEANAHGHEGIERTLSQYEVKLPEYSKTSYKTEVNPERSNSSELIKILKENSETDDLLKKQEKHFKRLLANGENPNQLDDGGNPLIIYVLLLFQNDHTALKLLLVYGANPFLPIFLKNDNEVTNALEHSKRNHPFTSLNGNDSPYTIIMDHLSRPKIWGNFVCTKDNIIIDDEKFKRGSCNEIRSELEFVNTDKNRAAEEPKKLTTTFKHHSKVTDDENENFRQLIKKHFKVSDEESIVDTDYEIHRGRKTAKDDNIYTEIIRDGKGNIVGVFSYVVLFDPGNKLCHYYVSLGILEEKFKKLAIARYISFRHAYGIKLALPQNYDVTMSYLAVVHNSGRAFEQFPHSPKYRSAFVDSLTPMVAKLADSQLQNFHNEFPAFYYDGQIESKKIPGEAISKNLGIWFFYTQLMGGVTRSNEGRGVPMLAFIDPFNFNYFARFYGEMKINFSIDIQKLSCYLPAVLENIKPFFARRPVTPAQSTISNSRYLIWNGNRNHTSEGIQPEDDNAVLEADNKECEETIHEILKLSSRL